MYTVLPETEDEFGEMVEDILSGYETMQVTDELVLRIRVDLNYLLRESGLNILDEETGQKIVAYQVRRDGATSNAVEIAPIWE